MYGIISDVQLFTEIEQSSSSVAAVATKIAHATITM